MILSKVMATSFGLIETGGAEHHQRIRLRSLLPPLGAPVDQFSDQISKKITETSLMGYTKDNNPLPTLVQTWFRLGSALAIPVAEPSSVAACWIFLYIK